jgi:hydroxypyruvate isomerase
MQRREFFGACAGAALTSSASLGTPISRLAPSTVHVASAESSSQAAPPFHFSVMLWTVYPKLPFADRLEKVSEAGYLSVELVGEYKDWSKSDYAAARQKLHQLNITVDGSAGVWHAIADPADRDPFLQAIRDFLPTMKELETSRLILQTGNKVPGLTQEQMHSNAIETLKRAGDLAAQNNIELLIENIDPEENPKYFLTSSAEGFEIIRSVNNPHVKLLYDFFHEQIAEGNLIAKLEKNIDLVGLVHVADVPGRHEPGTGEIHYESIFRKLGQLNYQRYVAMEFMATGDTVAALRAAREMAAIAGSSGKKLSSQITRSTYATA